MSVRLRALAVALILSGVPFLGALAETPHDDAGSGQDAPDQPDEALNVSPGAYVGNLTPGSDGEEDGDDQDDRRADDREGEEEADERNDEEDEASRDADWYRVNASNERDEPACTSTAVETDGNPHDETRVHLGEPAIDAWLNATATASGLTLAHVGPGPSGTLVGLTHLDPPRVTEYSFEVDVTTLGEVGDAGDLDEIPGPCFGDELGDEEIHAWTFRGDAGDLLHVSLATELARADELVLEAPNGTEVGSIVSGDDIAIGAASLPETGNYTLSLEAGSPTTLSTSDSTYLVGFSLLEDPEEEEEEDPCTPHCMN